MIREPRIALWDLLMCLANATDLVSPAVADHHKRVAYIAYSIGAELGLPNEERDRLAVAGAVHDMGALSVKERLDLLKFEIETPHRHAEQGYLFLSVFEPLADAASLVRFHHVPWNKGNGTEFAGKSVPIGSHILHLADRVAVLIDKRREILGQVNAIREKITARSGTMFMPKLVDAFMDLATKEFFWLDVVSQSTPSVLKDRAGPAVIELHWDGLLDLTRMFSHIIDFRSRFTTTHSAGVAASAEALAKLAGFSARECKMMKVAGYLHDLGKLAVPTEILEKSSTLTEEEFNVIRAHTFYTYRVLEPIADLELINTWASFHHERLDGNGYPFHLTDHDLSLGSRIMAVADVFTAVTEDRPYRKGMTGDKALHVLQQMAKASALDAGIVSLLQRNFDEVNSIRAAAQAASVEEYQWSSVSQMF